MRIDVALLPKVWRFFDARIQSISYYFSFLYMVHSFSGGWGESRAVLHAVSSLYDRMSYVCRSIATTAQRFPSCNSFYNRCRDVSRQKSHEAHGPLGAPLSQDGSPKLLDESLAQVSPPVLSKILDLFVM